MGFVKKYSYFSFFTLLLGAILAFPPFLKPEIRPVKIIKNPVPNCEEKQYSELKKIAQISDSLKSPQFLISPYDLVVDSRGNLFVYDQMLGKILKYDKNLKYSKSFGGKGQGPGEFSGRYYGDVSIYLGADDIVYAGDRGNQKYVAFDGDGNILKEHRLDTKNKSFINPLVDSKGQLYNYSDSNGIIDVYGCKGNFLRTIMSDDILGSSLYFKIPQAPEHIARVSNRTYCYYEKDSGKVLMTLLKDDRLLVYAAINGTFCVVENQKELYTRKIWPKNALNIYKENLRDTVAKGGFIPYFHRMYVDRDDEKHFYLHFGKRFSEKRIFIYQFDLKGNLRKVLHFDSKSHLRHPMTHYKRHGLIYAIGRDSNENKTIFVYKEKK